MDDDRGTVAAWRTALDDAFDHKWESLEAVLADVTEEEAAWQHAAYANEEPEAGWPLPGTIAWHVAHLAHCKRHYAKIVLARGEDGTPDVEPRDPVDSFAAELAALHAAHALQRAAIADVTDDEIRSGVGSHTPMDLAEFVTMSIRHDPWHGGQIALIRRLYKAR